jgi:hypothetical protein
MVLRLFINDVSVTPKIEIQISATEVSIVCLFLIVARVLCGGQWFGASIVQLVLLFSVLMGVFM